VVTFSWGVVFKFPACCAAAACFGDHVGSNSEAGRVRGRIKKKITSAITFRGYVVHASKEEPQYLIKSDTTDHLAMHKEGALTKLPK
jgi:hypothetical protein